MGSYSSEKSLFFLIYATTLQWVNCTDIVVKHYWPKKVDFSENFVCISLFFPKSTKIPYFSPFRKKKNIHPCAPHYISFYRQNNQFMLPALHIDIRNYLHIYFADDKILGTSVNFCPICLTILLFKTKLVVLLFRVS